MKYVIYTFVAGVLAIGAALVSTVDPVDAATFFPETENEVEKLQKELENA